MLDRIFWDKVRKSVIPKYRDHIFGTKSRGMKAKDVFGKAYDDYVDPQDSNSYGNRKKAGKIKKQRKNYKLSKAPVLTGALMNDFQLRSTGSSGFSFGTIAQGGTAKMLAKMGRVITSESKPIPDKVGKHIIREADKYVKKKLKKTKGKTFNIGK